MKFKNNPRNGVKISICISIIMLIILVIVDIIPNESEKSIYGLVIDEGETNIWKIICYVIIVILAILNLIVNLVMCRCKKCGKYISSINIDMRYSPYCSKRLDE